MSSKRLNKRVLAAGCLDHRLVSLTARLPKSFQKLGVISKISVSDRASAKADPNCTFKLRCLEKKAHTLQSHDNDPSPLIMRFNFQRVRYAPLLSVFLLVAAVSGVAQTRPGSGTGSGPTPGPSGNIQGRVVLPNGTALSEPVRVSLLTPRGAKSVLFTDNQGRFQFRSLIAGSYEVVVDTDRIRFEPSSVQVEVVSNYPTILTITLADKKSSTKEKKDGKNSVSAGELDPAIPDRAKQEFDRGSNASKEGKTEEAIAHLRQAVTIYPRYLMAHNDLGTLLLGQGKLDEAAEELRRAVEIDPKSFNPNLNLGIVLVYQHRYSEAGAVLQVAVSLDSSSPSARLYNGFALEGLEQLDEAERELTSAFDLGGSAYATALFHLGQVYLSKGDRPKAISAFERYLTEAPNARNAEQVRTLLSTLR